MGGETTAFTLETGAEAPGLGGLLGTEGKRYSLSSFADARLVVVVFTSNGCPTVHAYEDRLAEIHRRYADQGVQVVAVNANNPHLSPGDAYPEMVKRAEARALPFPYLKDEDGSAASAYGAICTPHAFVFDEGRRLRYQGRVDDARDATKVTSRDLENAIADLLAGRAPAVPVTAPFGCSIVW
jgi:peroxiredoxin